ncbi:MAG: protein translocase subunit SecD [Candidatus Latescibacteria bacterium]|nr:protein translocase subunit SecD [Candidatus Latescibacterota bacterium]
MGQWKRIRIVLIVATLFAALWYVYPTVRLYWTSWPFDRMPLTDEERNQLRERAIKLGLDLQGGVHLVMEVDLSRLSADEAKDAVDRAMQVISNRINQFGVAEPTIQREGDRRIIVELPGLKDVNRAIDLIGQTAQLEFKMLREASELQELLGKIDGVLAARTTTARDTSQTKLFNEPQETTPFSSLVDHSGGELIIPASSVKQVNAFLARPEVQALIPDDAEFQADVRPETRGGQKVEFLYYVNKRAELTGAALADARAEAGTGRDLSNVGRAVVNFTTTDDGAQLFSRVTGSNIGKRMAIILDGKVYSAPTIQGRIPNGRGEITGIGSLEEAKDLSIVLRAGALPAPVQIQSKQVVGPSLGADAIRTGVQASLIGLVVVLLFMLGYYRASGLIANFGLSLNLILLLAVMAGFHATLTLPGIAGIILTMGMAVDANILIFERIKEELKTGKTIRMAIDNGYSNALRTIIDSNLTTLITALALYQFGTGPIKGFAVTLSFGIIISMFTAIAVTRALYDGMIDRWNLKTFSIGQANPFGRVSFGFIRFAKYAFAITWAIIFIGLISIAAHRGLKWGIDFQGGSLLEVQFNPPVSVQQVRDALQEVTINGTKADLRESEIKQFGGPNNILVRAAGPWNEQQLATAVKTALKARFPDNLKGDESNWRRQELNVGPKIGKELTLDALQAVLWSIAGILIYIGFRFRKVGGFRFGVGGVVSLIHDVLIVIGIFSLIDEEISMGVVAALLTVVGYSINDTIVVYDRIREGLGRTRREGFAETVNRSINETLNRTVMTSMTILLVLILLLVGGGTTNWGFALALTIGVVTGTYSSIFVASPVVVWWQSWQAQRKEEQRQQRAAGAAAGATKPAARKADQPKTEVTK